MQQIKWFDRKFAFADKQNIFPSIIERLRGTPVRLIDKLAKIENNKVYINVEDGWSIAQNIGHLIDLEPLWQGRLDDILKGKKELQHADLENTKTNLANHNSKNIDVLLKEFSKIRERTVTMLEAVKEEEVFKYALHPRLKTPMRIMDLFLFTAEHDDHHLARITAINKRI